ncbi:MAG: hypothetical protein ABI867_37370 [Kofleriaceae bacterium]
MRKLLVLVVLSFTALRGGASADVWQRSLDPRPDPDPFELWMAKGDEAAISANSKSISLQQIRKDLDVALEAYRAAAKANPKSGEPHYRLGMMLHSFFFDCDPNSLTAPPPPTCQRNARIDDRAREVVEAWDAFEARAPLDPRVNDILLQRALLRTKLVMSKPGDKTLLEGALKDYQALLDRSDGLLKHTAFLVLGNLAETHMMLGQLEQSIDVYKEAVNAGGRTSTIYGLAVALDRDERGSQATTLIRDQTFEEFENFEREFEQGSVFYVPAGEEHYYFALAQEAFGNFDEAIVHWKDYIKSGAHPQYQPRAKEHLDALLAKKNLRWRAPIVRDPLRGM